MFSAEPGGGGLVRNGRHAGAVECPQEPPDSPGQDGRPDTSLEGQDRGPAARQARHHRHGDTAGKLSSRAKNVQDKVVLYCDEVKAWSGPGLKLSRSISLTF